MDGKQKGCPECGNSDSNLFDDEVCFATPNDEDEMDQVIWYRTCLKCKSFSDVVISEEKLCYKFSFQPQYTRYRECDIQHAQDSESVLKDTKKEIKSEDRASFKCPKCDTSDPSSFTEMKDLDTREVLSRSCTCGACIVQDIGNTSEDLSNLLTCCCPKCGNKDPNKFGVKLDEDMSGPIVMTCHVCATDLRAERGLVVGEETGYSEVVRHTRNISCRQCGNDNIDKFFTYMDEDGIPVDIECSVCNSCCPVFAEAGQGEKSEKDDLLPQEEDDEGDKSDVTSTSQEEHMEGASGGEPGTAENGEKKPQRKKVKLTEAADKIAQCVGFPSAQNVFQYYSNYGVRSYVKKAAYEVYDYGLQQSNEAGLLNPTHIVSKGLPESASTVALIGSRTGAFAGVHRAYVEASYLQDVVEKAGNRRITGDVNRERYIQLVVRQVGQSLGTVMGSATGSVIGTLVLTVPATVVAGNIAGLTVGALIGQGVGRFIGNHFGRMLGKSGTQEESSSDSKENSQ